VTEREEVEDLSFNPKIYLKTSLRWARPYNPHRPQSLSSFFFLIFKHAFII